MIQMMEIGVSKHFRNHVKLARVPHKFRNENKLNKTQLEVLHLLECRSYENNGDTKIFDDKISKILSISIRTVQRAMLALERFGFITRITEHFFDSKRGKTHRNGFYSDRVVRCNRIFLVNRCRPKTQEELGWKRDIRPKLVTENFNMNAGWKNLLLEEELFGDSPKYPGIVEFARAGRFSMAMFSKLNKLRADLHNSIGNAKEVLGFKRSST